MGTVMRAATIAHTVIVTKLTVVDQELFESKLDIRPSEARTTRVLPFFRPDPRGKATSEHVLEQLSATEITGADRDLLQLVVRRLDFVDHVEFGRLSLQHCCDSSMFGSQDEHDWICGARSVRLHFKELSKASAFGVGARPASLVLSVLTMELSFRRDTHD